LVTGLSKARPSAILRFTRIQVQTLDQPRDRCGTCGHDVYRMLARAGEVIEQSRRCRLLAHRDVPCAAKFGGYRGIADMVALMAGSTLVANDPEPAIDRIEIPRRSSLPSSGCAIVSVGNARKAARGVVP
jgi:hypothetical protein